MLLPDCFINDHIPACYLPLVDRASPASQFIRLSRVRAFGCARRSRTFLERDWAFPQGVAAMPVVFRMAFEKP